MIYYKLSDWTITPGGRFKVHGEFSGEEFRDDILSPLLESIIDTDEIIMIDLSGTYGLPTGFTEETFGGLVRKYNKKTVKKHIQFLKTKHEKEDIKRIQSYIEKAE